MHSVGDLVRHYPRRYVERAELTPFSELTDGDNATVLAEVMETTVRRMQNKRGTVLDVLVTDGHGTMTLAFFNQAWRESQFRPGRRGLFAGTVSSFRGRQQLAHPKFVLFADGASAGDDEIAEFAGGLIPVYPSTSTVATWQIDKAMRVALDAIAGVGDPIPEEVRKSHQLIDLETALRTVHRPADWEELALARGRLRFEEALVLQVVLAQRRHATAQLPAISRTRTDGPILTAFDARLPFELTEGQIEIGQAIAKDLAGTHPMHRLVQGDVGSGKTIVALRAMLAVVDAGGQAALLAPTEVLAAQHHRSITAMLGPLGEGGRLGSADTATRVALLTGSQRTAQRRKELLDVVSGDAGIVIGTHALLEDTVEFRDLGLVVVDEQHRFGVEQRAALAAKSRGGTRPHVLVMTATPIPRTIAMTVFGDLDVSTLNELPAGRMPIDTHVVPAADRPSHLARTWERVREEVEAGHRVFIVCPRIGDDGSSVGEEIEGEGLTSVVGLAERLTTRELSGLRLGVLHGRMPADAKEDAMARFADASRDDALDVLVSTTVIEVGVDVPIATMMVVMDADRFGISQLHQLRGRIGRGGLPGLCLLVTNAPADAPGRARLEAVASTTDGFALSQLDLEMRREGDVLGAVQSGHRSSLRLLRVVQDADIIEDAREVAAAIVAEDPELKAHSGLASAVATLIADEQAEFLEKA
jgi:ATP-dependent DNA helicase RecG